MELILKQPIKHGEDEISKLHLRAPVTNEIRDIGFPYFFTDEGNISISTKACYKYLKCMTKLPNTVLEKMGPEDFRNACLSIISFFGESVESA